MSSGDNLKIAVVSAVVSAVVAVVTALISSFTAITIAKSDVELKGS